LSSEFVNNGTIDCLGGSDEQKLCRTLFPDKFSHNFLCSNGRQCLQSSHLCETKFDCDITKDIEKFCEKNQQFTCNKDLAHNRSEAEKVLCGLNEDNNRRIKYFSILTSSNYPSSEKSVGKEIIDWPPEQNLNSNVNVSHVENNPWPWYCNRGLVAHTWVKNNSDNR
jgi:hypothetical protein